MNLRLHRLAMAPALVIMVSRAAFAAVCPQNNGTIGQLQNCASPVSTAPVFFLQSSSYCINGGGWLSYDLTAGQIGIRTFSTSHEGYTNLLTTRDEFVVDGPANAPAVSFSAILSVSGLYGIGLARLTVGSQSEEVWFTGATPSQLQLFLTRNVGEPFIVEMYGEGHASPLNPSEFRGALGFTALPAGFSLRSCQGYASQPVATRATSWGRVKQFYR